MLPSPSPGNNQRPGFIPAAPPLGSGKTSEGNIESNAHQSCKEKRLVTNHSSDNGDNRPIKQQKLDPKAKHNYDKVCPQCRKRHGDKPCFFKTGQCYICHEIGHIARNCPNKQVNDIGHIKKGSKKQAEANDDLKKIDTLPSKIDDAKTYNNMIEGDASGPLNSNELPSEGILSHLVVLRKDLKYICRVEVLNPPFEVFPFWDISEFKPPGNFPLNGLPRHFMRPAFESRFQKTELGKFLGFLKKYNKVAAVVSGLWDIFILPPDGGDDASQIVFAYRPKTDEIRRPSPQNLFPGPGNQDTCLYKGEVCANRSEVNGMRNSSNLEVSKVSKQHSLGTKPDILRTSSECYLNSIPMPPNFVKTDPSYLRTLGQTHSGWIFGAIADLIDNSRDAKAARMDISIQSFYSKKEEGSIPVLSVIDDGLGMSHSEIINMLSFGHKPPEADDSDRIGRFGIGFKTGAMKLGRDAIVLTQTGKSRSIALLSQSFNERKDNLEIPVVSYSRRGTFMEIDTNVHSLLIAEYHLTAIRDFSPFNEYFIGEKLALFGESGTGTQIYIWNLEKWGSNYCLEWNGSNEGKGSSSFGDILIRSRRIRSRPGQISQEVPLDYSLKSYLEVIFLDPRMKIFVQGSQVKSRPLAKSLNKTLIVHGDIMGKRVELFLGRSKVEYERANCGIFLYWHGRLIEAYKRVGGMIHSADVGRGVIGVVDVTQLMCDDGNVLVLNSKQGFQDCEIYARLEEWLGNRCDEYWDDNFDTLDTKKRTAKYEPDHEWVQCDKCRKWRILSVNFDTSTLPDVWFCYMYPYEGKCENSEQGMGRGVITIGAKRSGYQSPEEKHVQSKQLTTRSSPRKKNTNSLEESPRPLKRLCRGDFSGERKESQWDVI